MMLVKIVLFSLLSLYAKAETTTAEKTPVAEAKQAEQKMSPAESSPAPAAASEVKTPSPSTTSESVSSAGKVDSSESEPAAGAVQFAEPELKNISAFDEVEGMLVKKLTEPFSYDRQGRRDPFRLPEANAVEIPLGGLFGPFLELQEVNLDSLKLKAIILDPVKPKAVVAYKGPKGDDVSVRVYVGDYIGENFGQVQAIRDGQVIIVQTFVEGDQKSTTTKTLSIRK